MSEIKYPNGITKAQYLSTYRFRVDYVSHLTGHMLQTIRLTENEANTFAAKCQSDNRFKFYGIREIRKPS